MLKRLRTIATYIVVGLLILGLLLGAGLFWLVRRPWPQTTGSVTIAGISAPVKIVRDAWGVPQIYAASEADVLFGQGYAHAQDRLWQMEFQRRAGSGTLSEILGPPTLDIDRFLRTVGLRRQAEQEWQHLDAATRAALEAYASGVNAYITSHRDRLPLEFSLLGVEPAPWSPIDSIVWGKALSLDLSGNFYMELLRARLIADQGTDKTRELLAAAEDPPLVVPAGVGDYHWLAAAAPFHQPALTSLYNNAGLGWGSNNWVVHGSRTDTGKPYLANDTHLGFNTPSIWYQVGLHAGALQVDGFSLPGSPFVIIGHNQRIAWGVTNLRPDTEDLYIERLNDPAKPTQYQFEDRWYDLHVITETITVKDQPPVLLPVAETRHGPLVTGVLGQGDMPEAKPLALRMADTSDASLIASVRALNLAHDWQSFGAALRQWQAPGQNFVYADVDGNIGFRATGKIPVRAPGHTGALPVPGWSGAYEWRGYIPFDQMPAELNPPAGFIVTANNKIVTDDYPYHLASEWIDPYRAQRITALLSADDQISMADMQHIQTQTYSPPAEALRPYLLQATPEDAQQRMAIDALKNWDLTFEPDRAGATIYETWYWFLVRDTFRDELSDRSFDDYMNIFLAQIPTMINLMATPHSHWFDDQHTPGVETRDQILQRSLHDAVAWLHEKLGGQPDTWQWGRLHTATFFHQPLGHSGIGPLEQIFNSQVVQVSGDSTTVSATTASFNEPFTSDSGVSQRMLVDLAHFDRSLAVLAPGESGHLGHPHREDLLPLWQSMRYYPLSPPAAAESDGQGEETLTLQPEAATHN